MKAKGSGATRSGPTWVPVVVTVLLATFVVRASEERSSGRAQAENAQAGAVAAAAPVTPAVGLNVASAIPGQALVAGGTVPDTSLAYTLCLVPNGVWTIEVLTPTPTPTGGPTNTPTDTPTSTPTNTPTSTPTDTPTNTPVPPTSTPTDTPTNTPTSTPTSTPTDTPTSTPTSTPTDTPTNTPVPPTSTPTDTPTNTPVPPTITPLSGLVAPATPASHPPAQLSTATTGLAESIYSGPCVLQQPLVTATNSFSGVALGPAPPPGAYDLLLLGSGGTVLAAQDASAAAGLIVTEVANVPAGGRAGLLGFAFLVAAGAWVLLRQFR